MVIIGGITRLTGSGLSITKWDVVTGTIPPLTDIQWQEEFSHYTDTPQFKKINSHFGIDEFKSIYWWEYIHRLLGRLIGLVFVIPFIWFLYTKQLNRQLIMKCLLLFFMGGLQGFIGWYMVKSGLVDIPSVSHFRLALHLITAFITFGLTYWFALELINTQKIKLTGWLKQFFNFTVAIFALTLLQIIFGAFVAGLKAGHIYNTWPLMGDKLIADSVYFVIEKTGWIALVNDMSGVQFMHRNLAYLLTAGIFALAIFAAGKQKSQQLKLSPAQVVALRIVVVILILQFVLGVFTLLYNVPILLGVLHQVVAFLLFSSLIYLMHRLKRKSLTE
jgi:cytochrome c oxidase assembly protein subunit 15